MKLIQYLSTVLIGSILFSCSNADDPIEKDKDQPVVADATLSVKIINSTTRAEETQDLDNDIQTVAIAIFDDGAYSGINGNYTPGDLVVLHQEEANSTNEYGSIAVRSGKIKVLVLANIDKAELTGLKTLAEFRAKTLSLTTEGGSDNKTFSMSSPVYDKTVTASTTETIAVDLYRSVARIEFGTLTLAPDVNGEYAKDATFTPESIFLANVKSTTQIAPSANSPSIDIESPLTPTGAATLLWCGAYPDAISHLKPYANTEKKDLLFYSVVAPDNVTLNATSNSHDFSGKKIFYAYENKIATESSRTLIVVKGTYSYTSAIGTTAKTAYYTIAINDPATGDAITDESNSGNYIHRNTRYHINLTVKGPGSPDPFIVPEKANLAVKIQVAPWNVVTVKDDNVQ